MTILFWALVAVIVYTYVGYPVVVYAAGKLLDRRVRTGGPLPSISVVVAAYNEEASIRDRVLNLLASTYPASDLEVIVASDGSTDRTVEEASSPGTARVRVLELPRQGKAAALAEGVRHARGDVVVFTDANTTFHPHALLRLAVNFKDPDVGGVAGRTEYRMAADAAASGKGEGLYWRYDTWLKERESLAGSVVSAHGGMYAIRRHLFRAVEDPSVTDDFAISTAVVEQGRRLVFEPRALGYEEPMAGSRMEFERRVRLMTRGLRGVLLRRVLLNPLRYGFYSVALASRKVLRRLVPVTFPLLLALSVALAPTGAVYTAFALLSSGVLALACAGWALRARPSGRHPLLYVPFFFTLANVAAVFALANVARGTRIQRWTPQRHSASVQPESAT